MNRRRVEIDPITSRDHREWSAFHCRRDLYRADEERVFHQHQGTTRSFDRDLRCARPADRAGRSIAADTHRLDDRPDAASAARLSRRHSTTAIIFIANDPHVAGGTHLPDINMAMPVFHRRKLVGFMCNIAHHADVGGMVPGSMAGGMSEIYQEGLRLPVVRLFRRGKLQEDLLDLILLNVRVPHERRGDYFAQVAACRLGERRLREIFAVYGTSDHARDLRRRSSHARRERMRRAVAGHSRRAPTPLRM